MLLDTLREVLYTGRMTPLELREKVIESKRLYGQGLIDVDALYAAADAYIEALKAFKKRTHAKLSIPSRAYIIRAL